MLNQNQDILPYAYNMQNNLPSAQGVNQSAIPSLAPSMQNPLLNSQSFMPSGAQPGYAAGGRVMSSMMDSRFNQPHSQYARGGLARYAPGGRAQYENMTPDQLYQHIMDANDVPHPPIYQQSMFREHEPILGRSERNLDTFKLTDPQRAQSNILPSAIRALDKRLPGVYEQGNPWREHERQNRLNAFGPMNALNRVNQQHQHNREGLDAFREMQAYNYAQPMRQTVLNQYEGRGADTAGGYYRPNDIREGAQYAQGGSVLNNFISRHLNQPQQPMQQMSPYVPQSQPMNPQMPMQNQMPQNNMMPNQMAHGGAVMSSMMDSRFTQPHSQYADGGLAEQARKYAGDLYQNFQQNPGDYARMAARVAAPIVGYGVGGLPGAYAGYNLGSTAFDKNNYIGSDRPMDTAKTLFRLGAPIAGYAARGMQGAVGANLGARSLLGEDKTLDYGMAAAGPLMDYGQQMERHPSYAHGGLAEQTRKYTGDLYGYDHDFLNDFAYPNRERGHYAQGGNVRGMDNMEQMAEQLRAQGEDDDKVLAHINPQEQQLLATLSGGTEYNPHTHLPTYGGFKPFKALKKVAKIIAPVAGSLVGGALGGPAGAAIGGALGGGLTGGKKNMLRNAALGGLGGYAMHGGFGNLGGIGGLGGKATQALGMQGLKGALGMGGESNAPWPGVAANAPGATQSSGGLDNWMLPLGLMAGAGTFFGKTKQPKDAETLAQHVTKRPQWGPEDQPRKTKPYKRIAKVVNAPYSDTSEQQFFEDTNPPLEYMAHGGYLDGHTSGQDDKIPAELSDGEYVISADVVSFLGDGNNKAGAKKLDGLMKKARTHRNQGGTKLPPKSKGLEHYLRRSA